MAGWIVLQFAAPSQLIPVRRDSVIGACSLDNRRNLSKRAEIAHRAGLARRLMGIPTPVRTSVETPARADAYSAHYWSTNCCLSANSAPLAGPLTSEELPRSGIPIS